MDRKEVLMSPDYWTTHIQTMLYRCADDFMSENNMNRMQLAEHLNVSKGYVSQLLNGDYDHRLSKLVELSLAFGYIPKIDFVKAEEYIETNEVRSNIYATTWKEVRYTQINKWQNINESKWDMTCPKSRKEVA